jgi:GPH family glycoside/pentoside/hexuronide:cation symporter
MNPHDPDTTAETAKTEAPMPLGRMIAYGAPGFAGAGMAIPIGVLMPVFYSDVVMAPLGTIALAIAIARGFDALTDPLMGWLSDRTRSRFGRRKPWIALGVPLCAIFFYLLFAPPEQITGQAAGLWFGVTYTAYFLFHTIYQVPHGALGSELTLDYDERSRLFGIQSLFILVGVLAASVAPSILTAGLDVENQRTVHALIAGIFAVALVVLYAALLRWVPERPDFAHSETNPLVPGVRRALRNRPFRIFFFAGMISAIPAAIPGILIPYYTTYVLGVPDPEAWLGILLVTYFGAGLIAVPIWMRLAERFSKLWTLIVSAMIGTTGGTCLFFIGDGNTTVVTIIFLLIGLASSTGMVVLPSMVADVIDYDEFLTGRRREAQFGSFWAIVPKFVAIPGASLPLALLAWVGYVPNEVQSDDVVLTIRLLLGIFPAAFNIITVLILVRYPLSREVHASIRKGILAHNRHEAFQDPLTGRIIEPASRRLIDDPDGWFLDTFSPAELNRILAAGPRRAARDVWRAVVASGLAATACIWLAWETVGDLDSEPGPATILAVVGAGLSITAMCFHLLRIRPANQLTRRNIDRQRIEAHLADL